MMPFIACALLVVGCCAALVLDRLWIDAAQQELRLASEAGSLAAARELVTDDLLRDNPNEALRIEQAKATAVKIASQNLVAGVPVSLNDSPEGDIRFGQLIYDKASQSKIFVETDHNPHAVLVKAICSTDRGNPLGLFFRQVTGRHVANAMELAEVVIDNRIVELRALDCLNIPCLPLAVQMEDDPEAEVKKSWNAIIERKSGHDLYSYDSVQNKLIEKPDGIREIVLRSQPKSQPTAENDEDEFNMILLDLGNQFRDTNIKKQILNGVSDTEIAKSVRNLDFSDPKKPACEGQVYLSTLDAEAIHQLVGKTKIIFLYDKNSRPGKQGFYLN